MAKGEESIEKVAEINISDENDDDIRYMIPPVKMPQNSTAIGPSGPKRRKRRNTSSINLKRTFKRKKNK